MPNGVKYSTTTPTGSLRRGNVALGVTSNLGPSATTGFYSMPAPQSGKYIINKVSVSGIPNFFAPANDAELIRLARIEGATGADTGSAAAVLAWMATQDNLEAVNFEYESIVTDGLVLNLDAGFVGSYPTTGTTWYDLSGNNNGTLNNGPTFNSANSGSIVFDGVDDGVSMTSLINTYNQLTCEIWIKANPSNIGGSLVAAWALGIEGQWRMLYGLQSFSWVCRGGNGWYSPGTSIDYEYGSSINNIWFHVVGTYNGTFNSIYVNGTLQTTGSNIQGLASGGSMSIAGTNAPSNIAYGKGNFSNIRLYNRALSAAEVLQNYNAQKGRFGL